MARRTGPGISVKMILTSTLLILLIVVGFGVLNVLNVRSVYDKNADEKIKDFRAALALKGKTSTQLIAKNILLPLRDNQDNEIPGIVEEAAKPDPQLKLLYVLSRNKNVLAHCRVVRQGDKVCDMSRYPSALETTDLKPPTGEEESWNKIIAAWEERAKANTLETLVELELSSERDGHLQYFAQPVFEPDTIWIPPPPPRCRAPPASR